VHNKISYNIITISKTLIEAISYKSTYNRVVYTTLPLKRWLENGLESANALDYNWVISEGMRVLRLKKVLAIVGLRYEYVYFN
jgi:hypothetical protein